MAYKPVQYDFFNPMEELVPLVLIYNKAYQALDKKYEEYMDWLSSSSELLNRDEGAKALKEKYQNDLNIMADALAKGDLRTAHTVDPRRYWYPLKTKQKLAEILSNLIKEQRNGDPLYVYTQRYDENTPLGSITEGSTYGKKALKDLEDIGKSIGQQINDTNPEIVGYIMNGATALIQLGVPVEQAMEEMMGNTPLSQMIELEVNNFQLVDPYELQKARSAIRNGILQGVGTKTVTMHNSEWESPAEKRAARKFEREEQEEDAIRYYKRTGDYSKLEELGLAREYKNSKDNLVVEIGNHSYTVKYLDESNQDELRKIAIANNPALAKEENRSKLDEAVSNMIDLLKKGKAIKVAGGLTRDSQELSDRKIQNEVLKAVKEDIENKYGKGYEIVHSPNQELYYAYKEEKKNADSTKKTKTFYVVRRGEHGETLGMYHPDRTELIKALMDMYYTKDEIVDAVAASCWEEDKNLKRYKGQDARNAERLYRKDILDNYVIPIMEGREPTSIEDDALDDKEGQGSEGEEGNKYERKRTKRKSEE